MSPDWLLDHLRVKCLLVAIFLNLVYGHSEYFLPFKQKKYISKIPKGRLGTCSTSHGGISQVPVSPRIYQQIALGMKNNVLQYTFELSYSGY